MNLSCCQNQGSMLITFCKRNIHILMCFASVSPGITFLRSLLHTERESGFYLLSEVKSTHFSSYICIWLAWVQQKLMDDSLSMVFLDVLILEAKSYMKHPFILCPCSTKNNKFKKKTTFLLCLSSPIFFIKNILPIYQLLLTLDSKERP